MYRAKPIGASLVVTLVAVTVLFTAVATGAAKTKSTLADQQSVSVTIYNSNLGLVKDVRKLSLPTGVSNLWFEDVAAQIDPTSVHIRSVNHPKALDVREQNFEYDLISPDRLLDKYLGKSLELVVERDGNVTTVPARLIGTHNGRVYEMDGKIAINPKGEVVLPALPEGLISRPSLVWMLESDRKDHTVEASYLTSGINWQANYVAVVSQKDDKADLSGWVTIDNRSGATYRNATLKLVAGDVGRVQPEMMPMAQSVMDAQKRGGFEEESFFEYHLYSLDRPTTVNDNQTKQISLLTAADISVEKTYVVGGDPTYYYRRIEPETKAKVGVFLHFDNSKSNNMGMPLPKGVVRVYKKDSQGDLQFIGEDRIDHTPEDEQVRIRMGNAFDVVAERKQTDFQILESGKLFQSSYEVSLRNHKDEAITVSVLETITGDWKIVQSSHDFEKESSHRVRFDIPVPAKGESKLTYQVRIRR